ncbi:MAG: Cytosine/purine/uracil/thiamine/allantoin permease family protein, partial [uncultured Solirubrobacteraceae bacterium]
AHDARVDRRLTAEQRRPGPDAAGSAHLGHVRHRRAVDRPVDRHHDVHAGVRPHRGRDAVVAGAAHRLAGQPDRPRPHAAQRASGDEVRHPVPRARPGELRGEGRERRGHGARARRLRLVRHPDVDRGAGPRHADDDAHLLVGGRHRPPGHRLRRLLAPAGGDHPARHGGRAPPGALRRPPAAGRQRGPAHLGLQRGRRHRERLLRVVAADRRRSDLLVPVRPGPGREHRVLDHPLAEHPGLHALREEPALPARRPEHRDAADHDGVLLHRHRRDLRDGGRLRRADLGSGGPHRPAARRPARPARAGHDHRGHRPDLDEHGGERRLAVERLLEPLAPEHLLPARRAHHRGDRDRLVPVEALRGRRRLHLHLARRLREPARRLRGRDDRRLLDPAAHGARRGRPLPARGPLPLLGRVQHPRARRGARGGPARHPGLPERGHHGGRRGGRPHVPRRAVPLRHLRDVRAGRRGVLRAHADGRRRPGAPGRRGRRDGL